jgi:hypothetical protein
VAQHRRRAGRVGGPSTWFPRRAARSLGVASLLLAFASSAWAYRPFVSTDAAVADPKEVEIEFGYFGLARSGERDSFVIPRIVLNYGVVDRLELVGEFSGEASRSEGWRLVDPGLFLKAVLRKGVLQDRSGVSLAMEAGPLLPGAAPGEGGVGFEASGIASGRLSPLTWHLNLGGGVAREEGRPFLVWGLIGELSVAPRVRLVGEVSGESVERERPDDSLLIGFIWQPVASRNLWIDAGVRRGLTSAAPDWQVTLGLTVGFGLFRR